MCGILGYVGSILFSVDTCLDILKALEVEQLPIESSPVGGHGAGLMVYNGSKILLEKVGGDGFSPTDRLRDVIHNNWRINFSRVILGHVRRASRVFLDSVPFRECTQPYMVNCLGEHAIVSVHNGFLRNYKELRAKFKLNHKFESEAKFFIDSEVFPHLLEELIQEYGDNEETASILWDVMEGNNTVALIVFRDDKISLYLLHKGATRGLALWMGLNGEVLFASRSYIVKRLAGSFLSENDFELREIVKPRVEGEVVKYFIFDRNRLFGL